MPRESTIEARVAKWARENDIITIKLAGPHDRGKPDRLFLYRGRIAFVEFKATGKRPTKLQLFWMDRLKAMGFWVECFDDADEAIRRLANHLL